MDDQQLVARIRAGDPAAERALYERHVERVYRLAYRITGDGDAAQDCTQEAFIKAFAKLETFRGEAALGTWIGSIAISIALTHVRSSKRRGAREVDLDEAHEIGTTVRHADPDLKQRLHQAIDELPEGYRTVFVLHDVEGYTHDEIGALLGVQSGTSKAQLFRARARLRERLADFARG